ncbi:MAG: hypothetical protein HQK65_23660 [Desulfamplus sp.]|nr:hypothetical protein [Desulfamplus sp.]
MEKEIKNKQLEMWIERANISKRQICQIAGVSTSYLNMLLECIGRKL